MKRNNKLIEPEQPLNTIYFIRGQRVILDTDLARIYGVPVKRSNEAVKRNKARLPEDFMFQLTQERPGTTLESLVGFSYLRTIPPYAKF